MRIPIYSLNEDEFRQKSPAASWLLLPRATTLTAIEEEPDLQHRKLETILAKMRDISETILLQSVPGPARRKRAKPS